MPRTTNDAKYIATALRGAEEGDELSIYVEESGHYRGEVIDVSEDDLAFDADVNVLIDDGEMTHDVYARFDGDDDASHTMSSSDDYSVFAAAGEPYDVTALVRWGDSELPDKTLDELEGEKQEEMVERLEEELEDMSRALTELQAMRKVSREFLDGEKTLTEMEEDMTMVEMNSGGRLVLESR